MKFGNFGGGQNFCNTEIKNPDQKLIRNGNERYN